MESKSRRSLNWFKTASGSGIQMQKEMQMCLDFWSSKGLVLKRVHQHAVAFLATETPNARRMSGFQN